MAQVNPLVPKHRPTPVPATNPYLCDGYRYTTGGSVCWKVWTGRRRMQTEKSCVHMQTRMRTCCVFAVVLAHEGEGDWKVKAVQGWREGNGRGRGGGRGSDDDGMSSDMGDRGHRAVAKQGE